MTVSVSLRTSDRLDAATVTFSADTPDSLRDRLVNALQLGESMSDVELLGVIVEAEQVVRAVRTAAHGLGGRVLPAERPSQIGNTDLTAEPVAWAAAATSEDDVAAFQKRSQADTHTEAVKPSAANVEPPATLPPEFAEVALPEHDPIDDLLSEIESAASVKQLGALYGLNKGVWSDLRVSSAAKRKAEALKP
jgi:hypothetical protein